MVSRSAPFSLPLSYRRSRRRTWPYFPDAVGFGFAGGRRRRCGLPCRVCDDPAVVGVDDASFLCGSAAFKGEASCLWCDRARDRVALHRPRPHRRPQRVSWRLRGGLALRTSAGLWANVVSSASLATTAGGGRTV